MDAILGTLHARAAGAGACRPDLAAIAKCGTWKRALAHERAPYWAYWYAYNVISGPWAPGEAAIAQNAECACCYALYVIKGPWAPGEAAIAQNAECAYRYARDVVGGPWKGHNE